MREVACDSTPLRDGTPRDTPTERWWSEGLDGGLCRFTCQGRDAVAQGRCVWSRIGSFVRCELDYWFGLRQVRLRTVRVGVGVTSTLHTSPSLVRALYRTPVDRRRRSWSFGRFRTPCSGGPVPRSSTQIDVSCA